MSDDRQMERVSASALRLVWRCFDTVSVDDTKRTNGGCRYRVS